MLLLCGGNIDTSILGRCLDRGLAIDGRLVKFHATLSDRPGGIAELCRILATIGVCVKDIIHERPWLSDDVFSVRVGTRKGSTGRLSVKRTTGRFFWGVFIFFDDCNNLIAYSNCTFEIDRSRGFDFFFV